MEFVDKITLLSILGGIVGAVKIVYTDKSKVFISKLIDVVIGALVALAVAKYFTPDKYPETSIFIGLIAGSLGGSLLDSFHQLAPTFAKSVVDGILDKLGYSRKGSDEDKL